MKKMLIIYSCLLSIAAQVCFAGETAFLKTEKLKQTDLVAYYLTRGKVSKPLEDAIVATYRLGVVLGMQAAAKVISDKIDCGKTNTRICVLELADRLLIEEGQKKYKQ